MRHNALLLRRNATPSAHRWETMAMMTSQNGFRSDRVAPVPRATHLPRVRFNCRWRLVWSRPTLPEIWRGPWWAVGGGERRRERLGTRAVTGQWMMTDGLAGTKRGAIRRGEREREREREREYIKLRVQCTESAVKGVASKFCLGGGDGFIGTQAKPTYQGCGAVTFLVGSGSGEAFRLRLRLRVKLFGGSGSGQNVPAPAAPAPVLKSSYEPYLTSNTIFKNVKYQNMTSYWLDLEFECYFEWVPLKFVTHCHPRSVADTGEVTNSLGLRCQR